MNSWKNLKMVVTVILLGLAAACSLFKQNIEVLQVVELRIDQPAESALKFSVQKDVNTNTAEVQKYADDMNDFVIRKITYRVKDFQGSHEPFVSGTLEFAATGSSEFTQLSSVSGLHLQAMAEQGQEGAIELADGAVKEKLTQLLRKGSPVTFRLNAETDNNPIAATLVLNINTQMTIDI